MKAHLCIIFIFISGCLSLAQVENTNQTSREKQSNFNQDFLNFASEEEGKTRLDAFVQVPYNEVQFVKASKGFSAQYSITISIFDEDKEKLIVEKMWNEKLDEENYDQTTSKNNYNLSLRSFILSPGKYLIRSAVEDKDSKNIFVKEDIVNVRDLSAPINISDIMLISKQTQVESSNKILPNVSKNVYSQKDGIPLFFEIYSDSTENIKIEYSIKDKDDIIFQNTEDKNLDTGRTQVFQTINNVELSLGDYILTISLKDNNDNLISSSHKYFISRWIGLPSTIKDIDKAIDQLVYIASNSEIDHIEEAETKEEKLKRYQEFWQKKDPAPQTEENQVFDEYYRRISYADENFSHYIDGWRTDRGMVYIILGSPSNVERHPFEYDSKPYEVWEYYELNKSFVFLDETGFGDYRLITPLYGDFYRYR